MIIFVDMDEVIADAYQAHIDIYNQEFNAQFTAEECMGREFWQCVPQEHQQSVRDHTHRDGFFKNLAMLIHNPPPRPHLLMSQCINQLPPH